MRKATLLLLGLAGLAVVVSRGAARSVPESEALRNPARAEALGLYRGPGAMRVSPPLAEWAAAEPRRPGKVWVFFTDKGVGSERAYRSALARFAAGLSEKARARRTGVRGGLNLEFTDLPVHRPYVDALRSDGFAVRRESRWLNAVSVSVPLRRVKELAAYPFVRYVQPVAVKRADPGFPDPAPVPTPGEVQGTAPGTAARAVEPGPGVAEAAAVTPAELAQVESAFYGLSYKQLDQIRVLDLHRMGYTGAGVTVMMLDTGYQKTHPAFAACTNIIAEYDFVMEDGETQDEPGDPANQHLHGTGTFAVLGGFDSGDLVGPAWAADFVLAKTEDVANEVRAEEDNYVAALEWGDTLGVDVTSASIAYFSFDDGFSYSISDLDGDTAVITQAVDIAVGKGICCVNSAGNAGPADTTIFTPVDADSVISVGAVDSTGMVATFSSRGPTADGRIKPEIAARGVATHWAQSWTGGYGPANGTSLSCPLIGGLAALLKEAHPGWDGATIRSAFLATGSQAGSPDNDLGWGIADGVAALNLAAPAQPRMTLPFALCEPADSAVVPSVVPKLVWTVSEVAPGDTAVYEVSLIRNGSPETYGGITDTCLVVAAAAGDSIVWSVTATGNQGYTRKSYDTRVFRVDSPAAVPGEPGPAAVGLAAAFPNPMRSGATIRYRAPEGAVVTIEIVAVTGRLVRAYDAVGAGDWDAVTWDGRDGSGAPTAPGVYFYRLRAAGETAARRLVRLP